MNLEYVLRRVEELQNQVAETTSELADLRAELERLQDAQGENENK